jgi:hypothetical protein
MDADEAYEKYGDDLQKEPSSPTDPATGEEGRQRSRSLELIMSHSDCCRTIFKAGWDAAKKKGNP